MLLFNVRVNRVCDRVVVFIAIRYHRCRISLCHVVTFSCDVAAYVAVCVTTCDNTNLAAAVVRCAIVSKQSQWRILNIKFQNSRKFTRLLLNQTFLSLFLTKFTRLLLNLTFLCSTTIFL